MGNTFNQYVLPSRNSVESVMTWGKKSNLKLKLELFNFNLPKDQCKACEPNRSKVENILLPQCPVQSDLSVWMPVTIKSHSTFWDGATAQNHTYKKENLGMKSICGFNRGNSVTWQTCGRSANLMRTRNVRVITTSLTSHHTSDIIFYILEQFPAQTVP